MIEQEDAAFHSLIDRHNVTVEGTTAVIDKALTGNREVYAWLSKRCKPVLRLMDGRRIELFGSCLCIHYLNDDVFVPIPPPADTPERPPSHAKATVVHVTPTPPSYDDAMQTNEREGSSTGSGTTQSTCLQLQWKGVLVYYAASPLDRVLMFAATGTYMFDLISDYIVLADLFAAGDIITASISAASIACAMLVTMSLLVQRGRYGMAVANVFGVVPIIEAIASLTRSHRSFRDNDELLVNELPLVASQAVQLIKQYETLIEAVPQSIIQLYALIALVAAGDHLCCERLALRLLSLIISVISVATMMVNEDLRAAEVYLSKEREAQRLAHKVKGDAITDVSKWYICGVPEAEVECHDNEAMDTGSAKQTNATLLPLTTASSSAVGQSQCQCHVHAITCVQNCWGHMTSNSVEVGTPSERMQLQTSALVAMSVVFRVLECVSLGLGVSAFASMFGMWLLLPALARLAITAVYWTSVGVWDVTLLLRASIAFPGVQGMVHLPFKARMKATAAPQWAYSAYIAGVAVTEALMLHAMILELTNASVTSAPEGSLLAAAVWACVSCRCIMVCIVLAVGWSMAQHRREAQEEWNGEQTWLARTKLTRSIVCGTSVCASACGFKCFDCGNDET